MEQHEVKYAETKNVGVGGRGRWEDCFSVAVSHSTTAAGWRLTALCYITTHANSPREKRIGAGRGMGGSGGDWRDPRGESKRARMKAQEEMKNSNWMTAFSLYVTVICYCSFYTDRLCGCLDCDLSYSCRLWTCNSWTWIVFFVCFFTEFLDLVQSLLSPEASKFSCTK